MLFQYGDCGTSCQKAGALLAAYVSRVTEDGSSFKANISAVFIVDNTFRIIFYSVLGLLTLDTVKSVLLPIPFALLGLSGISLILKNL